ncbi:MAG TPA: heme-degrading domain-containing protein [Ktedonobacterales bacterium]|nr:heme-degrading domain-containing protein [Ktedonobacterales bacterium]
MDVTNEALTALLREEETLQFSVFDNVMAWRVGSRLVEMATERGLGVTIDIRRNGQQLFHCALPGTSADNDEWIKRKNRVVNRYGHSSLYVGMRYRSQGTTFEEKSRLNPDEYAAHGGAFPIIIARVGVVGTVTVSGLAQEEDHQLVVSALREFAE